MSRTTTLTDRMLCRCLQIKESQVSDCILLTGADTVREVAQQCGAGGGCNSCHRKIRDLIAAQRAQFTPEND